MNVLFDNCTSPVLATTLDGYIQHLGHRAFHLSHSHELGVDRHAKDEEWITAIHADRRRWIVITGDDRIRRVAVLRSALRHAQIQGFVLAAAYQKTPLHITASLLVRKWPEMEQQMTLAHGPALFEISINQKPGFRPLPLWRGYAVYMSCPTSLPINPSHFLSSLTSMNSSGLCACSMLPGPQMTAGMPICWNRPASVQ